MKYYDFYLDFNVRGPERDRLVQAISRFTEADVEQLDDPAHTVRVDYFSIDEDGIVSFDSRADSEEIESLLEVLYNEGFVSQNSNIRCVEEDDEI